MIGRSGRSFRFAALTITAAILLLLNVMGPARACARRYAATGCLAYF